MNQVQIHLALTHVPVILSITGFFLLLAAGFRKEPASVRVALYILAAAGLFALPVFLSGEGAEEVVERMPDISGSVIETHEQLAEVSVWLTVLTGLLALAGLFRFSGRPVWPILRYPLTGLAVVSMLVMAFTAHLGGQIRHTELQDGAMAQFREMPAEDNE